MDMHKICLFLSVLEVSLCFVFLKKILIRNESDKRQLIGNVITITVVSFLLFLNRQYILVSWDWLVLQSFLIAAAVAYLYEKNFLSSFGIAFSYNACISVLNMFYLLILMYALKDNNAWKNTYWNLTLYRLLIYIGSLITIILVYLILRKQLQSLKSHISNMHWILIVFGIFSCLALIWSQSQAFTGGWEVGLWTAGVLMFMLLLSFLICILAFEKILTESEIKMIDLKNQMLVKNYEDTKKLYENSIYTYHDIKNHVLVLQNYAKSGNLEKIQDYLNKIAKPIEMLNQYVWSDNEIINLILNTKILEAQEKKISISTTIENTSYQMEEKDLCSILSNLLENAIEACEKVEKDSRWIKIWILEKTGCLIIKVENAMAVAPVKKNGSHVSSKSGSHGYGLKSVESVTRKYDGVMNCGHDKNCFSVTITFFK